MRVRRPSIRALAEPILGSVRVAIVVLDRDFRILFLNYAAEALLGVSRQRALGRPLADLVEWDESLRAFLSVPLSEGQPVCRHEFQVTLRGGTRLCTDASVALTELRNDERVLVWELTDVDERLRRSASLLGADLEAANRGMLSGFAHEVKNPLGGIRGAAQLLERQLPDANLREYTEVIISEADRLRKLLDRMVSPEQDRAPFAALNIHEVLERIRLIVTSDDACPVRVERDYDPSIPQILGNFDQLVQAFLNIARNAVQAIEESGIGGRVLLRTRVVTSMPLHERIARLVLRVEIEDDGPGIPEALRSRIFFPLVTGRPSGTGLGLSIARSCLARHGGLLEMESAPGRTLFTALLPIEPIEEARAP